MLFYKFVKIKNPKKLMEEQKELCASLNLKGRMLLAKEGVNATFEGTARNVNAYKKRLKDLKIERSRLFKDVVFKESEGNGKAFTKLEIKVRDEVVTLGAGKFDIQKETAKQITAKELQTWYKKEKDFVVLDLRNDFEIEVGQMDKTVHPNMRNFRELPEKIKEIKNMKDKQVVTVCTGGIRCEKATCLLKQRGFKNLYQLKDGLHTYIQKYPGSHFKGSLFVFDNRMTTPVAEVKAREIIGRCIYCSKKCEQFASDDSLRPSRKVICCPKCFRLHSSSNSNLRRCTPN